MCTFFFSSILPSSIPSHTDTHTRASVMSLTGVCCAGIHARERGSERHSARVRGWDAGAGNGKASEESNHQLTARHDWKYAKYSPRNGDGYSPLARGAAQTLPSILNRRAEHFFPFFLRVELNDKNRILWHLQWERSLTVKRTSAYLFATSCWLFLVHSSQFRCLFMIHVSCG